MSTSSSVYDSQVSQDSDAFSEDAYETAEEEEAARTSPLPVPHPRLPLTLFPVPVVGVPRPVTGLQAGERVQPGAPSPLKRHGIGLIPSRGVEDEPHLDALVHTADPNTVAILYRAPLDHTGMARSNCFRVPCCCLAAPSCLCYASKLKGRSYVHVQENRVEANYPALRWWCCGGASDRVSVHYFREGQAPMRTASLCTPYHFCGVVECAGEVAARAWAPMCDFACCCCCKTFYPGLEDADAFVAEAEAVRTAGSRGVRMTGPHVSFMHG